MSNPTVVSALGSVVNIQMVFESTQYLQFALSEREIGTTAFTAVNLAGATVKFTVRDRLGGTVLLTKENGPGDHQDDSLGTTRFTIAKDDFYMLSEQQQWTTLVYEVRRIESGEEFVHISGNFVLKLTAHPAGSVSPSMSPSPSPSAGA